MKYKKLLACFAIAAVSATVVAGCGSNGKTATNEGTQAKSQEAKSDVTMPALVDTNYGTLLGTQTKGTYIFKGIPYAKASRFAMPEDPDSWEGIKTATTYGEGAPNSNDGVAVTDFMTPAGTDCVYKEDCQFLNVWTNSIDTSAKKPVVFWLHGGGWANGASNELSYYDGYNFAQNQDVVFVSINHRLNILGYTDLSAYGEEYANSGNVGVADMVKALEWVNENIENFGGDPENVTIIGQSGGGAKVMTLLGIPDAKDYFQKAIVCSGGVAGISADVAKAAGTALVEKCKSQYGLGSDEQALEMLKTMPYEDLLALSTDTGVGVGPVVDGTYYPAKTITDEGVLSDLAKDKPVIVSTTFSEIASGGMAQLTIDPVVSGISANMPKEIYLNVFTPALMDENGINQTLSQKYPENLDKILEAFKEAFPGHDDLDLAYLDNSALTTDGIDILNVMAEQSNAPVYRMYWAEKFPLFGGMTAWHTGGDLPFLFDNLETVEYMTAGDDGSLARIEKEASTMLGNFAKTGDPSFDDVTFKPYTTGEKAALIFDNDKTEVRNDFDGALRPLLPVPASMW